MNRYILKLSSGTSYKLYLGTTLVPDADLTALFSTAGSAYFAFDFDGSTPSSDTTLQITNSADLVIMENTGLVDAITDSKNYKGTWGASATTFSDFTELSGKTLDESQLGFLMGEIKTNTSDLEGAAYIGNTLSTPTDVAYVSTANIQDGAVTPDKIDWTTIRNIDVSSYFTIDATPTRAFITVFGKIGFVDLAFNPANNFTGNAIMTLPDSLGISPIYTSELVATIANDTRRALITRASSGTQIAVEQHTGSAGNFTRIFGMFFLG